jgi:hypothetical protein
MSRVTADECQCKRCGSSMFFESCDACNDGLVGHDCGEDCCSCADPIENVVCGQCGGHGGWYTCLSSIEWCEANPRPGCEFVERHTPEWLCRHGIGADADCQRCAEGDVQ